MLTRTVTACDWLLCSCLIECQASLVGLFPPKLPSISGLPSSLMGLKYGGAAEVARATCQIGSVHGGPGLRSLGWRDTG